MKAYLCQTEVGPQYIHLQTDAKKLDPNFETVELDISKGPLLEQLNDLMRKAHAKDVPSASPEEEQDTPPAPTPPPAPKTKAKPALVDRIDALISWEELIWDIPAKEAYRLDVLQKVIDERRAEIARDINVWNPGALAFGYTHLDVDEQEDLS